MNVVVALVNLLALAGLGISLYFALLYYGALPCRFRVGIFCYGGRSCQDILQTSYSRLFGFPNVLGGMIYYGVLLSEGALRFDLKLIWVLSLLAVLVSLYLVYILHFRLKSFCIFCTASHIINFGIFLLVSLQVIKP